MTKTKKSNLLSDHELQSLAILRFELPSLLISIDLAEKVADGQRDFPVRNPVVWFLMNKAVPSVVENLLLRIPEIVHLLDRALISAGVTGMFTGTHRKRRPTDPILDLAFRLRQEDVAHRIAMRRDTRKAWTELTTIHGSIWAFLRAVLKTIDSSLLTVEARCTLKEPPPSAARYDYQQFSHSDVEALIQASESLWLHRGAEASPASH